MLTVKVRYYCRAEPERTTFKIVIALNLLDESYYYKPNYGQYIIYKQS